MSARKNAGSVLVGALLAWTSLSAQQVVWRQGFNTVDRVGWDQGSFGENLKSFLWLEKPEGRALPAWTEGDGFGVSVVSKLDTSGKPQVLGRMVVKVLDCMDGAGSVYEFRGKIGWRYGTKESAADLFVSNLRTGFFADAGNSSARLSGPLDPVYFGRAEQKKWTDLNWQFVVSAKDAGKPLYLWIEFCDQSTVSGINQILADDWVVEKIPGIIVGMR